jgi:hypothetical protein
MERATFQSKAHALLREIPEMEIRKQSRIEIWRAAVNARAYAVLADDKVLASNAAEYVARYAPHQKYSAEQRREIHRKALRMVAGFTPAIPSKQRDAKTGATSREELIAKLRQRTVANGCSPNEARAARDLILRLTRGSNDHDTSFGLNAEELARVRAWLKRSG